MMIRTMVMVTLLVVALAGCAPATSSVAPTPTASERADVDAYSREQAACVATYTTREEIDACRAKVREAHGRPVRP